MQLSSLHESNALAPLQPTKDKGNLSAQSKSDGKHSEEKAIDNDKDTPKSAADDKGMQDDEKPSPRFRHTSDSSSDDDEKDSKAEEKECKSPDSSDDEKKHDVKSTARHPPPLSFPATYNDPFLDATVSRDAKRLQQLLALASLAHLSALRDELDRSALQIAIGIGDDAICQLLLNYPSDCGSRPASPSHQGTKADRSPKRQSPNRSPHAKPGGDKVAAEGLSMLLFGLLESSDAQGRTILHYACHSHNPKVCRMIQAHPCISRMLHKHVAHLDTRDEWGMRPLGYAALHGNRDAVSWCFQLGCGATYSQAEVNQIVNLAPGKALRRALVLGFEQVDLRDDGDGRRAVSVKPWMEYVADSDLSMQTGTLLQSTLHKVVQFGSLEDLENALERQGNVNVVDANGWTALHYCASISSEIAADMAERLLQCHDIDVDVASLQGKTALHIAAASGQTDVLRLLLLHNADANATDQHGWTPLHCAAHAGAVDTTKCLVRTPTCNLYALTTVKQNALHLAASGGHDEIVAFLCSYDVELQKLVQAKDIHGHIPVQVALRNHTRRQFETLWQAAWNGQPEKIQALLHHTKSAWDLNATTPQTQKTILHLLVMGFASHKTPTKAMEARYDAAARLLAPLVDLPISFQHEYLP
ncbi:hypothetical protein AC1031_006031 [Aphanomyces cochlioides]|nr:hypothetical protein AC1031_006031 [Aphanomyces cochlioides]